MRSFKHPGTARGIRRLGRIQCPPARTIQGRQSGSSSGRGFDELMGVFAHGRRESLSAPSRFAGRSDFGRNGSGVLMFLPNYVAQNGHLEWFRNMLVNRILYMLCAASACTAQWITTVWVRTKDSSRILSADGAAAAARWRRPALCSTGGDDRLPEGLACVAAIVPLGRL